MSQVTIERIANGGDGVGSLPDGRVVFVPRAVPGDVVEVELTKSKKRWAKGRIRRLVKPSDDRIDPGCEHFRVCGGCDFQHVPYPVETRLKEAAAKDAFERISGLSLDAVNSVPSVTPTEYRVRVRWHASERGIGYYKAGTRDVFPVRNCPILHPRLQALIRDLPAVVQGADGEISAEVSGDEVVVAFSGRVGSTVAQRVLSIPGVRGVKLGREEFGDPTIDSQDAWGIDSPEQLEAGRFRQSNGPMTPELRRLVRERVGSGPALVEFYAGSGSFTHHLANDFGEIVAYEADEKAVNVGKSVAKSAGNSHIEFVAADLESEVPPVPAGAVVLLDPPRTGAQQLSEAIATSEAARIVYVSCDIGTLARDCKAIAAGRFSLESFDFVDMFPRTAHIEAIATFVRHEP